jgi:hypothetical protein
MIKVGLKNSPDPLSLLKREQASPIQHEPSPSLVLSSFYSSSNPFPSQPIAFSLHSSNPFPNQLASSSIPPQNESGPTSLPLPDEAGFKIEMSSKKRKTSPNLLPALKTHSPTCMEKRKANCRIKQLFKKPVHSFRIRAAKMDNAESLQPNKSGEIHCNGRVWGVHENAGKGPRIYPKRGPGIYTFSGKKLEIVFNEYRALKTPTRFEEFLIQRAGSSTSCREV